MPRRWAPDRFAGASRAGAVSPAQAQAIARKSQILANDDGELRIRNADGQLRDQPTIAPGDGPYPQKG
ncbi:DUF2188 domain-containing protein [[Actinomadura] parvosata]|uniref:DUF2188 domain-containing protein n=1 Tax=[Actinomadura] parvosata TaxID=1955412 RepID=UPI00406D01BF